MQLNLILTIVILWLLWLIFYLVLKKNNTEEDKSSINLFQQQILELSKTIDSKLSQTNKSIEDKLSNTNRNTGWQALTIKQNTIWKHDKDFCNKYKDISRIHKNYRRANKKDDSAPRRNKTNPWYMMTTKVTRRHTQKS